MFHFHQMNSFSYPLWLIPVYCARPARCHSAKPATACANISKDHKSRSAFTPTFPHVGTITTFADRMKFVLVYQASYMLILLTDGQFHPKPIRLFYHCLTIILFYNTIYYG